MRCTCTDSFLSNLSVVFILNKCYKTLESYLNSIRRAPAHLGQQAPGGVIP